MRIRNEAREKYRILVRGVLSLDVVGRRLIEGRLMRWSGSLVKQVSVTGGCENRVVDAMHVID